MARKTEIIEAIHRGLADMQAGRLISHDEAMAEVDAAINESGPAAGSRDVPDA